MPPLQELFETHALVKILDFLTLFKNFEYTRTDIAKETGISRRTLYEVFPTLEKYGLVQVTKAFGKVKFYKLNMGNPISQRLIALADEIAFYNAQKVTGIELATKILPNHPSQSPCATASPVKVTIMQIEANSAADIKDLVHTTSSTQSTFGEVFAEVKKAQVHCK
jgi:AcrR family transcriptional regulator